MKILLGHTYYMQRGGEDCCFEEERDYLRAHGHEVVEYVRDNEDMTRLGSLAAAATTLWNRQAAREVRELIVRERPDVVHLTNTFPLISPAVCYAASRAGVPVVHALQNYRWLCANGYLMRNGGPCEDCVTRRLPWQAVRHRCYRDSAAASAAVVAMQVVHRRLSDWMSKVDAFFAPTEFARQRFIAGGFPAERVHVKCNFVAPDPGVGPGDGDYVAFVGRLSPEKGVATLLAAWASDPTLPPLVTVGDGPMGDAVAQAAARDERIQWRGHLPLAEVHGVVGRARALVMSSLWYETFGRTMAEAFAAGTPVIASRLGAMTELVDDGRTGWHFTPGDAADLAAKVRQLAATPTDKLQVMRAAARAEYEGQFTAERNYMRLMEIYAAAMRTAGRRRGVRKLVPQAASA